MNFFQKILKHKKILFAVFFVFILMALFGIKIETAKADCDVNANWVKVCSCDKSSHCVEYTPKKFTVGLSALVNDTFSYGANGTYCRTDADCARDDNGDIISTVGPESLGSASFGITDFGLAIIAGLSRLVIWLFYSLANLSAMLFDYVRDNFLQKRITGEDPAFVAGWVLVRDFANMLVVLGFVAIGIATAIRFREYEAKKLLLPLIIVALMINFSGLFCGLIIDFSNMLTGHFDKELAAKVVESVAHAGRNILKGSNLTNYPFKFLSTVFLHCILYLIITCTFIYVGIILIIRYAILVMLYILSPAAFVFWVFTASKKLWTEWWNHFLKWCFVGFIAIFFMNIAVAIIGVIPQNGKDLGDYQWHMIIGLIFMIVGVKLSAKSSGIASMVSGAALGLAAGVGGFAMGAVGAGKAAGLLGKNAQQGAKVGGEASGTVLGAAADKTRLSGAATAAKDWATQRLENMGAIKPGRTAGNQQARLNDKDRMNRINNMTADQKVAELEHPRAGSSARLDRAAIVKSLAENNQLSMVANPVQRQQAINNAIATGVRPKDLIGGMDTASVAAAVNTRQYDPETTAKGVKTLIDRNELSTIRPPNTIVGRQLVNDVAQHGVRIGDLAKSDYRWRAYDSDGINQLATSRGITPVQAQDEMVKSQLESNLSSMSYPQINSIDAAHITPDLVTSKNFKGSMVKAFRTADPTRRAAITHPAVDTALTAAIAAANASGNTAERNRLKDIQDEINKL